MTLEEFARAGGKARAKSLAKSERSEISKRAAAARWKGHKAKRPASSRKQKGPPHS